MPNRIERVNTYHRFTGKGGPMSDMNVTPFIDILLVLVIMLIMSVPIAVNNTEVDLPTPAPCVGCVTNPDENTIFIGSDDQLYWNGRAVDPSQLRSQVAFAHSIEDEPLLKFEPASLASYDQSSRTIALIKDSGANKLAFIGNAQHREFGR
ncbi:MAG: biopolymer transporter ExbD, partial [Pseudomonadota bacterium]